MERDTKTGHDAATCHACGQIALRRTSGAYLDPNSTVDSSARVRSLFVRQSDAAHAALFARLEALSLRDDVVRALDGATAGELKLVPASGRDYARAFAGDVLAALEQAKAGSLMQIAVVLS